MASDEPRIVRPGDMGEVVLSAFEAFDILEALEGSARLAGTSSDIELGARLAMAESVLRRALRAE